jgi:hypothetical protein
MKEETKILVREGISFQSIALRGNSFQSIALRGNTFQSNALSNTY